MSNVKSQHVWQEIVLFTAFGLYIIILLVLLFGKASSTQSVNLIPFHTITDYFSRERPLGLSNVIGNVLLFIPLGVFLSLFTRSKKLWLTVLSIALISASAEVLQYSIHIGAADIDDVILNIMGGLVGIALYHGLHKAFKEKTRWAIGLISLGVGILFLFIVICLWTGVFGIRIRII